MNIDNNFDKKINFNSRFLDYTNISKISENTRRYWPAKVSFTEIDVNNKNDLRALHDIKGNWESDTYCSTIYNNAISKSSGNILYDKNRIFVLTSQKNCFEKMDSDKILGLAEVREDITKTHGHLCHLQVKPEYYEFKDPEFKGVGTSIINMLKQMYNKISLISLSTHHVKEFYRKNDFVEVPEHSNSFVWIKDILSMLDFFNNGKY